MLLEMEFYGLSRIISGGQTGADQGALFAAAAQGVTTGGMAPRGWMTSAEANPSLARFGLTEHPSSGYKARTIANVRDSDATLIIASNFSSPGTKLTVERCIKQHKPYATISLKDSTDHLVNWVIDNNVSVLNVAGNRDPFGSTVHYMKSYEVIFTLIDRLKSLNKDIGK